MTTLPNQSNPMDYIISADLFSFEDNVVLNLQQNHCLEYQKKYSFIAHSFLGEYVYGLPQKAVNKWTYFFHLQDNRLQHLAQIL